MVKANPTNETQASDKFPCPTDPCDRWIHPAVNVDARKPIRFQQEPLFPSEGRGLMGQIFARFCS